MADFLPGSVGWLVGFVEDGHPLPLLAVACALEGGADWSKRPLVPPGLVLLGIYSTSCPPDQGPQALLTLLAAARPELPELAEAESSGYLLCAAVPASGGQPAYFLGKAMLPTEVPSLDERRELFLQTHVGLRATLSARLPEPSRAGASAFAAQLHTDALHFDFPDAQHMGIVAPSADATADAVLCADLAGGGNEDGDDEDEGEEGVGKISKHKAGGSKGKKGGGKAKSAKRRPGGANAVGAAEKAAEASAAAAVTAAAATRNVFSARALMELSRPAGGAALSLSVEPPSDFARSTGAGGVSGGTGRQGGALQLDVIVQCRRDSPLCSALHSLRLELAKQSEALGEMMGDGVFPTGIVVHPEAIAVPLTVTFALRTGEEASEPSAQSAREALHLSLGLPCDRPLFRTCNALGGGGSAGGGIPGLLQNVHLGLAPSGLVGGTVSLVQGLYEYYHYMQPTGHGQKPGKYDDNGWGCAYRSLMSIISWFRLQKYTSFPNPTHYEIQKTLVQHCGQEADDLLGKKKWLGSFDLSLFLEHALGVQCKTISCNSGHEVATNARQLGHHFDTQGTPVMIGGGQVRARPRAAALMQCGAPCPVLSEARHRTHCDPASLITPWPPRFHISSSPIPPVLHSSAAYPSLPLFHSFIARLCPHSQLAFTLLPVIDLNDQTGEARFLIMDCPTPLPPFTALLPLSHRSLPPFTARLHTTRHRLQRQDRRGSFPHHGPALHGPRRPRADPAKVGGMEVTGLDHAHGD
jgi:hypothetical protein